MVKKHRQRFYIPFLDGTCRKMLVWTQGRKEEKLQTSQLNKSWSRPFWDSAIHLASPLPHHTLCLSKQNRGHPHPSKLCPLKLCVVLLIILGLWNHFLVTAGVGPTYMQSLFLSIDLQLSDGGGLTERVLYLCCSPDASFIPMFLKWTKKKCWGDALKHHTTLYSQFQECHSLWPPAPGTTLRREGTVLFVQLSWPNAVMLWAIIQKLTSNKAALIINFHFISM